MEEPLNPRQFLRKFHLPQLVKINDADLQTLNAIRNGSLRQCHHLQPSAHPTPNNEQSSGSSTSSSSLKKQQQNPAFMTSSSACSSSSSTRQNRLHHLHGSDEGIDSEGASPPGSSNRPSGKSKSKSSKDTPEPTTAPVPGAPSLELDQPFLLYKAYECRQVIGHILDNDENGGLRIDGPALLIPDNYPGWFSLVTPSGRAAGYFETIDQIAQAWVPYFLTKYSVTGYALPRSMNHTLATTQMIPHNCNFEKVCIAGGQVLRFMGVYQDMASLWGGTKSRRGTSQSLGRKHGRIALNAGVKYAKCAVFSSSGEDIVFIPIAQTGRFYVIGKKTSSSFSYVYPMSQILRIAKFPTTVQLIVGPKPRNYFPTSSLVKINPSDDPNHETFSAMIRLEEIRRRDVVLACTLRPQPFSSQSMSNYASLRSSSLRKKSKKRSTYGSLTDSVRRSLRRLAFTDPDADHNGDEDPVLLEFDLDSNFNFVRTFMDNNKSNTLRGRKIPEQVLRRLEYCNQEADVWRRQIKIAHDVIPRLEQSACDSMRHQVEARNLPMEPCSHQAQQSSSSKPQSSSSSQSRISKMFSKLFSPLNGSSSANSTAPTNGNYSGSNAGGSIASEFQSYQLLGPESRTDSIIWDEDFIRKYNTNHQDHIRETMSRVNNRRLKAMMNDTLGSNDNDSGLERDDRFYSGQDSTAANIDGHHNEDGNHVEHVYETLQEVRQAKSTSQIDHADEDVEGEGTQGRYLRRGGQRGVTQRPAITTYNWSKVARRRRTRERSDSNQTLDVILDDSPLNVGNPLATSTPKTAKANIVLTDKYNYLMNSNPSLRMSSNQHYHRRSSIKEVDIFDDDL